MNHRYIDKTTVFALQKILALGDYELSRIYQAIELLRPDLTTCKRHGWQARVRRLLETHSSDSEAFDSKKGDLFRRARRGVWGVRTWSVHTIPIEAPPIEGPCECGTPAGKPGGDAWRCATRRSLPNIHCGCKCHKYIKYIQAQTP